MLHEFGIYLNDGTQPYGKPILHSNGNLYGTTTQGGSLGAGTIYSCDTLTYGSSSTIYSLNNSIDGNIPIGTLLEGSNGVLYGTNAGSGPLYGGTLFSCSTTGEFGVLHSFSYVIYQGGRYPNDGVIEYSNGILYGTTSQGGTYNYGTIYSCDFSGNFNSLYSFSWRNRRFYPKWKTIKIW